MQGAQEAGDKEEGQKTREFFQNLNSLTGKKECDWHCGGVTRTSSITGSQSDEWASLVAQMVKNLPAMQISGLDRTPGGVDSNPL